MFAEELQLISRWLSPIAFVAVPELLEALLKGSLVLLLAWLVAHRLNRSSASLRHQVWLAGLLSVLVMPLLPSIGVANAPLLDSPLPTRGADAREPVAAQPLLPPEPPPAPAVPAEELRRPGSDSMEKEPPLARENRGATRTPGERLDERWPELAFLIWLAGVFTIGLRYAYRQVGLARLRREAKPVDGADWVRSLTDARKAIGLTRAVSVLTSARTAVPFAWGRYIVFPETANLWPRRRRDLALLHELAHARRRDHLGILTAQLACSLYWMNPLVWLAANRLEAEREAAADDAVLAAGARPSEYARVLLAVASRLGGEPRADQPAIVCRATIEKRLRAILDPRRAREIGPRRFGVAISGLFALMSVGIASIPLWATTVSSLGQSEAGPAELSGSVEDEQGRPLENATVFLWPRREKLGDYSEIRTDRYGRFQASLDERDSSKLYVTAAGFAPWTRQQVDPTEDVKVVLARGIVLEGIVRDARTRAPIADARVGTLALAGNTRPLWIEPGPGVVEVRSDEGGRFRLEGLAKGPRTLLAAALGHDRAEVDVAAGEEFVEVLLRPGSGILGTVRAPDGEPVAGATVHPIPGAGAPSLRRSPSSRVKSDDRGRFELLGLAPGRYRLMIVEPDHAVEVIPEVELPEETTVSVDATLSEGVTVTGRLVHEQGAALTGHVRIAYLNGEELPWVRTDEIPHAETGVDGRFELLHVPRGRHEVLLEPLGFAGRRVAVDVEADATQIDLGEIRFATGLTIEGFVEDEVGDPVAGVDVYASTERSFVANVLQGHAPPAKAVSGDDGSFVIAGLEPGAYKVAASSRGLAQSEELIVEAGTLDVDLILKRAGALRGRVVDVDGKPIPSFSVSVEERFSGGRTVRHERQFNDAGGAFLIEGLSRSTYTVTVSSRGLKPTSMTRIEIPGRVTIDLGDVVLREGGVIRGRVLDPDGSPVPGATLTTHPEAPGGATVTDADGDFEILGFVDGVVDIRASHPDYAQAAVQDVEVRAERGPAEVEIRLSRGGRLEGRVRDRAGRGVADRLIRIGSLRDSRARSQFRTGTDGSFSFERLPFGKHRVELLSGEERLRIPLQAREVEIEEGLTAFVELESSTIQVFGQARKGGVPLSGVQVTLRPDGAPGGFYASGAGSDEPFPMLAVTGADGFYELWVDHSGPYTARVTSRDGATRFPSKEVVIPDVDSHLLDLAFDTVSVAGLVISMETQEPIAEAQLLVYPMTPGARAVSVSNTRTNAGGAFRLELQPGSYQLRVQARDYAPKEQPITVEGTPAELSIELSRGREIVGRVVDTAGNPPGRFYVHGIEDVGPPVEPPRFSQWGDVHPDGTFELRDLADARYNVLAGSDLLGFAFAPGLRPGDRPLLRLRPAEWVNVIVRDPDGASAAGARVAVIAIGGHKTRGVLGRTDEEGKVELYVPTGDLELKAVGPDGLQGVQRVAVSESARASTEIRLRRD